MAETIDIAGWPSVAITAPDARAQIVMLHGYAMRPEDLSPFAASIGLAANFYFPSGPLDAEPSGRAWWSVDQERKRSQLATGPRDLAAENPAPREPLRRQLVDYLETVKGHGGGAVRTRSSETLPARAGELPLILAGFSQGGMLACDTVLHLRPRIAGLALLSSSRIDVEHWAPLLDAVRGLPVLVSHGRSDADLAFAAGENLKNCLVRGGAEVTWVPFDGGHQIPLSVWRALRKFVTVRAHSNPEGFVTTSTPI